MYNSDRFSVCMSISSPSTACISSVQPISVALCLCAVMTTSGCAPGYGSYLPKEYTADFRTICYPSRRPSCNRLQHGFNWAWDCKTWIKELDCKTLFPDKAQARCQRKRAIPFPPFVGRCQCFQCPSGFTSPGGPLGIPCTPTVRSAQLSFLSSGPCTEAEKIALTAFYRAELLATPNIIPSSVKVVNNCVGLTVSACMVPVDGAFSSGWYFIGDISQPPSS